MQGRIQDLERWRDGLGFCKGGCGELYPPRGLPGGSGCLPHGCPSMVALFSPFLSLKVGACTPTDRGGGGPNSSIIIKWHFSFGS